MKIRDAVRAAMLIGGITVSCGTAMAAETLEEVIVFGRGERLIGVAEAASEGAVGGADLSVRPLLRVAELLEVVPGLIAAQHSGSGKANQYFLRGFNLDHGTDFTAYIDDVPLNMRTHGHGQGYLDVNGLIPETIDRIDYRKGTYRADAGDFSMAGAAFMSTVKQIDSFVGAETGEYGWQRFAAGGTVPLGEGELTALGQWKTYDGPWEQPEDLEHESLWAKYSHPTSFGFLEASVSGYHAKWRPTEQIPEDLIGTDVCEDEFCSLDPTAVGETLRWIASVRLLGDDWRATAYGQYYDWRMMSNPTYDFQIDQFDRRWIGGGRYERSFTINDAFSLRAGVEGRYDDIGNVGVAHTEAGNFLEYIGRHSVKESSAALYTEANWQPIERLRAFAGLRADYYDFEVRARMEDVPTGDADETLASPKLGLAFTATDQIELYANWGKGFHSNDARGIVAPEDPIKPLSAGTGKEVGARFEQGTFKISATYWWLDLDSELKFVGDSNSVEPGPATERRGYELTAFWRPTEWLALDAVWTKSHARYVDNPDGPYVAGAVENAGEFGVALVQDRWEGGLRVRHLGEFPLVEDDSDRSDPETCVNVRGAWKPGNFYVYAEVINVFDEKGKDMVYSYETNVPGVGPLDGRVSRAEEPRTLRAGVKYHF
ncbi:MAG TPA: TonB-dependent receptor [Steroidobacteraceae bacterium]|nr:TonB-dependent receptor [Steroidobacteraceae bacterium]